MSKAEHDRRIDYVEFAASDLEATKAFYTGAFGWRFTDYGPEYAAFEDGRLDGGFRTDAPVTPGGPLVILYAADLAQAEAAVLANGGTISTPAFSFPGGRRFHFRDPNGNELGVWSET